jgi:hypothetical protein
MESAIGGEGGIARFIQRGGGSVNSQIWSRNSIGRREKLGNDRSCGVESCEVEANISDSLGGVILVFRICSDAMLRLKRKM